MNLGKGYDGAKVYEDGTVIVAFQWDEAHAGGPSYNCYTCKNMESALEEAKKVVSRYPDRVVYLFTAHSKVRADFPITIEEIKI